MISLDLTNFSELPLLRTKITAPLLPAEFVQRPRLTERIDRGVMGPLTLLAAPAGFGKTNLLIEWKKETSLPVAWLNIDSDDNEINRFFRYLIGVFQTLEPRLGEEALDFILSTRGTGLDVALTLLINEISALPKEMVLALDDFQALEETTILQGIGFFLKHLPQNLHVVIASRSEPALGLTTMRAKGRVTDLGMEDLRFTGEEVALFFQKTMELQLPIETIQVLEKRTDGWVTGLQMAAISLKHHSDPMTLLVNLEGTAHYLVDFLAEEVLDRQPEEIRQFLLRSSILNTLTGSLCEAVVNPEAQPGYGTVMLNRLEHAKLFITALDEKHEWFRYHPLFVEFLRHILAEINLGEIPVLQKRAALWLEQNSNLDEAIKYAQASGDVEWTANIIERNLEAMVKTGGIFTFTRWIAKLPDELIVQRPRLSLAYAWGLIAAYQIDNAMYWIDNVQQTLDQIDNQKETTLSNNEPKTPQGYENTNLWNIRGWLVICQSTLALLNGDTVQAAEFSKQAANYLGEENPFINSMLALDDSLYFILSGDTQKAIESLRATIRIARRANNLLVMIIASCQLAEMQALQGQLNHAWATLQTAQYMATGPEGKLLPMAGLVDVGFGEILLERDSLAEANAFLERGIESTGSFLWLSNLDGMVSLARLRQAQGDISGSQTVLEKASHISLNTESSQWDDVFVSTVAIRLALRRNDLPTAEQWWMKCSFPDYMTSIRLADYPYHVYEYIVLTQVRLLLTIGRNQRNKCYLKRCVELMESLLLEAERFQRGSSQIEIRVLQAMVQFALGEIQQSVKTFRHALALGEPEGYRRIYLDEGQPIAELLELCKSESQESNSILPSSAFINSLLASFQGEVKPVQFIQSTGKVTYESLSTRTEDGFPISLSAREMEVLALIAEGKSNQEISAQLYLALNTVKRHAYNIYAKLEVKKRTQAVSKARQLGLIL